MRARVEQASFAIVVVLGLAVSAVDLLGMLPSVPWLNDRVHGLVLLAIVWTLMYLLIKRTGSVEVRMLSSLEEYYRYLDLRVGAAEKSVDDLTWGALRVPAQTDAGQAAFQSYFDKITTSCSNKPHMRYRELMTFHNRRRVDRAIDMLNGTINIKNYFLRYYRVPISLAIPLLQFTIIDGVEVILGAHRGIQGPVDGEPRMALRHTLVVRFFQDYFEAIWHGGEVLKDRDVNNMDDLRQLRDAFPR
jgi:hypothetical protein